ncbi:hypothetical protein AC1031_015510 [Aphanomyces cochlioides]|nr:hypothetical protein AC1031_015510 [Aphanomyces cochlioides]
MEVQAALSSDEIARYSRQLLVKDFGVDAQQKLLQARVLVIGAGGLGCPVLVYLSGMGVGHLGIVDGDNVDLSNLHRQILHTTADIGRLKVESARDAVLQRAPSTIVDVFPVYLDAHNAESIVRPYDVIVDASDNVATRYLVNDVCCILDKPLVSGSALGLEGQVSVYHFKSGPCYRCCYPKPLPQTMAGSCAENGVIGVVPGIIGSLQAMETVKIITGMGYPLSGVQCALDAWDLSFRHYKLPLKRADCAVCGTEPIILSPFDSVASIGPQECENPTPLDAANVTTVEEMARVLRDQDISAFDLLDVRESVQYAICSLQGFRNIPWRQFDVTIASLAQSTKPSKL